jgi:hypothetical protein
VDPAGRPSGGRSTRVQSIGGTKPPSIGAGAAGFGGAAARIALSATIRAFLARAPPAISSMVRPVATEVRASSTSAPPPPGRSSASRRLTSSHWGWRASERGLIRTRSQAPRRRRPCRTNPRLLFASASAGSATPGAGSQVPSSQTITVPAPWPASMAPSKVR